MNTTRRQLTAIIGVSLIVFLSIISPAVSNSTVAERLNLLIYDFLMPLNAPTMSKDIVVIAIDEASIQELGRWPWSRAVHADLINRLTDSGAKAIGMDILFSEQQNTAADDQLGEALKRNGRTVLMVAPIQATPDSPISEILPIPDLAIHAAALAQVDTELDIDGSSRAFFLYAGLGSAHWPSAALAIAEVGGFKPPKDANIKKGESDKTGTGWVRDQHRFIPYTANNDQAKRLSFTDVIHNRVPAKTLKDKYILIGTTTSSIGDMVASPGQKSRQRIPGVILLTQQLNGLLKSQLATQLPAKAQTLLTIALIALTVISTLLIPFRISPLTFISQITVIIGVTALLMTNLYVWFSPATSLLMVVPIWICWGLWRLDFEARLVHKLLNRIEHQTQHHAVTGLPNQRMLEEILRRLTNHKPSTCAGLFIIHIEWPKSATSILGRANGDSILITIAEKLQSQSNGQCFITHLSGDDFGLLITEQADYQSITVLGESLLKELLNPFDYLDDELVLSPHIGVSLWPEDGVNGLTLLQNAYTAMFKSRLDNDQGLCRYSPDIDEEIKYRSRLEQCMRYALEREEFELYYQPQIDTLSGNIIGAEALLRWNSPTLGRVSPATFIPIAEHSGMIIELGDWVLEQACHDLSQLNKAGFQDVRIAVNVSAIQFSDTSFVDKVASTLNQSHVDPHFIELEMTESTLMSSFEATTQAMHRLQKLGVSLAIDDFGTGYSSLHNLQSFPLQRLKIDQTFTREIGKKNSSTEVTLAIISMAKRLSLKLIAEGVETPEHVEFYTANECEELQGFLYSPPVPFESFKEMLHTGISLLPK